METLSPPQHSHTTLELPRADEEYRETSQSCWRQLWGEQSSLRALCTTVLRGYFGREKNHGPFRVVVASGIIMGVQ